MNKLSWSALALAAALGVFAAPAQAQRSGDVAAGVAAGIIGGAILGGALAQPPAPQYEVVQPRRRVVVEDDEEVVVQRCRVVRQPVVDQWGETVGYRQRRICN
jgi:hypothetical protein